MAKPTVQSYKTKELIIAIDRASCISCGTCIVLAPNTFELDKKLISQVKENSTDATKEILLAAQGCAVETITVVDQKSGKKLWPKT